jgi:hypothetical protein
MLEDAMSIEAMKLALEVLTDKGQLHPDDYKEKKNEAITALRTAIAQAEKQEPVAWEDVLGAIARGWAHPENARKPMDVQLAVAIAKEIQDMYTTPPAAQRQWVGLTDEDFENAFQETYIMGDSDLQDFAKVIEAKLKEKNT